MWMYPFSVNSTGKEPPFSYDETWKQPLLTALKTPKEDEEEIQEVDRKVQFI